MSCYVLAYGQLGGYPRSTSDATRILDAATTGDPQAATELLPLRVDLDEAADPANRLLEFDEILTRPQAIDPVAARLMELRYFAGLTTGRAVVLRTAERTWTFAHTWLHGAQADRPTAEARRRPTNRTIFHDGFSLPRIVS